MKRIEEGIPREPTDLPSWFFFPWVGENKTGIHSSVILCITAGPVQFLRMRCGSALGKVEADSVTKLITGTSP